MKTSRPSDLSNNNVNLTIEETMNKKELYNKILQLDGLTNEEKSELLGLLRKQKKYGLVWEDKPEDVEERLREELPVLVEDTTKAIICEEADASNHILIEGDNLEALTALAYTHEGKIDVIYIDPPYNTGKNDFVYNDSFIDSEDTFRHSKWLSFMSKRLRIAKRLLSEDGVIFIQVDDNEYANLKLLCDEIWGEKNALGPIIQNKLNAKNDTLNIQKNHEYILCYRNRIKTDKKTLKEIPILQNVSYIKKEAYKEQDKYYYLNDTITTRGEGGTLRKRTNLGYSFYVNPDTLDFKAVRDYDPTNIPSFNDESKVYQDNQEIIAEGYSVIIRPPRVRNELGVWTWDIKKVNAEKENLVVINNRNGYIIKKRTFVAKNDIVLRNSKYWYEKTSIGNSRSILEYSTNDGSNTFNNVFNHTVKFNNPKNLDLIVYLIKLFYRRNITILDFFAGSGTTLHATMQLNAEDDGHRKCILVTNNENNICEEVTYERIKRVINGYTTPKGEEVPGLKGNTLRYYRTSFVGRSRSMKNMRQLMNLSTDMLCIKEDLYAEQQKFGEQQTFKNVFRYFDNGKKRMMIIYREEAVQQLVDLIQKTDYEGKMHVYVFSPSEDPWEGEFEEVQDKVLLYALPQAIYNAYRRILPKKKDEPFTSDDTKTANQDDIPNGMLNFDEEEELQ